MEWRDIKTDPPPQDEDILGCWHCTDQDGFSPVRGIDIICAVGEYVYDENGSGRRPLKGGFYRWWMPLPEVPK